VPHEETPAELQASSDPTVALRVAATDGRRRPSDALLIATAPAAGYVVAWAREWGYAQRMGTPPDFIDITTKEIVISTFATLGVLVIALRFLDLLRFFRSQARSATSRYYQGILWSAVVVAVPVVIIYRNHLRVVGPLLLFFIVVGAIPTAVAPVIPATFFQRREGGLRKRLEAQIRFDAEQPSVTTVGRLSDRYGDVAVRAVALGLLVLACSAAIGDAAALDTTTFLTVRATHEVVLQTFGSNLVVAKVTGHRVENSFRVLKLGADPNLELVVARVGPLKRR
jgi:hypothetical protein